MTTDPMAEWLEATMSEPDSPEHREAVALTADLDGGERALVLPVAAELWANPPEAIKQSLSEGEALRLTLTLLGQIISEGEDVDDAVLRVQRWVTGLFETERQAAFATIRQFGGPEMLNLQQWVDGVLGDPTSDAADAIRRVKQVAPTIPPGLRWVEVPELGWVLYRVSDSGVPNRRQRRA